MKTWAHLLLAVFAFHCVFSLPVDKKAPETVPNANAKVEDEIDNLGLEYGRYLQEVVMALEQDKDFSKKLENISSEDIKSGKIAGELDFVHHSVRTKLDELKRVEMDRLHKLLKKQHELEQFGGSYSEQDGRKWRTIQNNQDHKLAQLMTQYEHLDHSDPHSFSKDDLHKLIVKATADLEELDKKRREEFKTYEMEKELQYQESLQNLTETEKKEAIKKHDDQVAKHKQHARLHSPGSKQQLEEVWQEQDNMPKEEFNPKTFFSLRDVNGDGVLDQDEVESMLSLEVRKMYDPNNPEDDANEMMEEYHRMREEIYREADKDRDGLISRKEFLDLTSRPEFEKDEGWKGLDEKPAFTQQELHEYEKHRQEALAHQYAYYMPEYHGVPAHHAPQFVPPPPPHHPPPVGYQQQGYAHPAYANAPPPPPLPQHQQQQFAAYPNQAYAQPQYAAQPPAYQQQQPQHPSGYAQPQIGNAQQASQQQQQQQQYQAQQPQQYQQQQYQQQQQHQAQQHAGNVGQNQPYASQYQPPPPPPAQPAYQQAQQPNSGFQQQQPPSYQAQPSSQTGYQQQNQPSSAGQPVAQPTGSASKP